MTLEYSPTGELTTVLALQTLGERYLQGTGHTSFTSGSSAGTVFWAAVSLFAHFGGLLLGMLGRKLD